ncbi:MAG: helix-turn-helix domain-containing protein [Pseudomonadota bacterium]
MRTRRTRAWSAVPDDVLTDRRLSPTARLVLAYCLGRPDGWEYHPSQICAALGIGRDAWRAARQQLERVGYLRQERIRRADGTISWDLVVTDTPATTDGATSDGSSVDGGSVAGSSGDITYKEHSHSNRSSSSIRARTRARERERGDPAPPAAAAAPQQNQTTPTPTPGGKARRVRASGIVTWDPGDAAEAERLEAETSPDELAAAVAAVRAAGREPVPGLVAMELDRRRRAAEGARRLATVTAAAPPPDPEALARGLALLPPGLRARALRLGQEDNTKCAM